MVRNVTVFFAILYTGISAVILWDVIEGTEAAEIAGSVSL
jgi:hypothetical protein